MYSFNSYYYIFQPFIILFIYISLISGPLIPEILLIIVIINLNLYGYFNNELKKIYNDKITILFFIFYLYLLLTSLLSLNALLSLEASLFYFRFYLLSLAICHVLYKNNFFEKYFAIFFGIIFLLFFFHSIINFLSPNVNTRFSSIFFEEKKLGSYIIRLSSILMCFTLCLLIKLENDYKNYILFFIFLLTSFIVLSSGERAALVLLIIFFFIYLLTLKFKLKIIIFSIFILFIIIVFNLGATNNKFKERFIISVIQQTNIANVFIDKDDKGKLVRKTRNFFTNKIMYFSLEHQSLYTVAINIFKDNYLFGIGPKTFRVDCDLAKYKQPNGCSTHPHNTYIQFLAETGIVGFIFICMFFSYISYKLYKILFVTKINLNDKNCIMLFFSLIAIFINLWPILPHGNFFNNWLSFLYYLPLGLFLSSKNNY